MLEIFRMQVRQMMGGKRIWLVAILLVLPVLLTFAMVNGGAFGELQKEIDAEREVIAWAAGELPATARRVTWEGEDLTFIGGALVLGEDGLRYRGRPIRARQVLLVNDGYIFVRDGELWVDPAKAGGRRGWSIRFLDRRDQVPSAEPGPIPELETIYAIYLFLLYPQAICLLLALFYGTSVLGEELEGKTLTYLFTRPLPRWRFVVGKYLGIVVALVLPTALSLLAAWLLLGAPGGLSFITAIAAGTIGGLSAYNALFVLFGFLIPRRAMIAALLYGVFFELILSFVPAIVNEFAITYYLRSLVVGMLDLQIPREIARMVGGATLPGAGLALAAIIAGSLAAASILAARREYVVKDTA